MKKWKIYSIIITIVLVLLILGICLYIFIFKENITQEEAKTIAFNKAEVDKNTINILSINKDKEDREYEISFYDDLYEYEVNVNYNNGKIDSFEKNIKDVSNIPTVNNASSNLNSDNRSNSVNNLTNNVNSNTQINQNNLIGIDKAKEIVLSHLGTNDNNITFKKEELDYNHNIPKYEIELFYNNLEYEYEINAITGEILKYEMKR